MFFAMQIASVKAQSALAGVQQNLREGDFVFVKVLKNLGGSNYSVSFAGARFNVTSERALAEGQAFRARISLADGKVLLTPSDGSAAAAIMSDSSAALLQSLGLAADSVSARILQFLTQAGAKLDAALMQKVRRLAQSHKGKEAAAAEAALVLEEKGIDSDSSALDELLDLLDGGGDESQDQNAPRGDGRQDGEGAQSGEESQGGDWTQDQKAGAFGANEKSSQGQNAGASTDNGLPNREDSQTQEAAAAQGDEFLRALNRKKGWAFFPYEFLQSGGVIRLYLDREKNAAEKMIVNYKSSGANFYFAVYFNGKKEPRAVKVWADQEAAQEKLRGALGELAAAFGADVKTELVPPEKASAFGVEDAPLLGVEAFA